MKNKILKKEISEMVGFLQSKNIDYQINIPLKRISGINQEGKCNLICYPKTEYELQSILSFCLTKSKSFDVIGNLTNTYIKESFNKNILISTIKFKNITIEKDNIICSTGYNLTKLARWCVDKSIAGYEGFIGIPGTVGAAAINNSGAFYCEMSNVVESVTILTKNNKIEILKNKELDYSSRNSSLKSGSIVGYVLNVRLSIKNKESKEILMKRCVKNKIARLNGIDGPRKSLGSIFVSTSLHNITKRYRYSLLLKKICYAPFKLFIKDLTKRNIVNTHLVFFFLRNPKLAKHCDCLNRFCWCEKTTEIDFFNYIDTMQALSNNTLELEIDIKGN